MVAEPSYADPAWLNDDSNGAGLLAALLASPASYALFATGLDGTIRLWSAGAASLYGYQPAAVVGRLTWWDMCADGRAAARHDRVPLETALREGSWTGTVTRTRQTGDRLTIRCTLTGLYGEPGHPVGFLTMSRDISGELRQVSELERAHFAARAVFEANVVALVATDPLGIITDINHPAEVLTGRSRDGLVGTQITGLATDQEQARAALRTLLAEGKLAGQEFTVRRPDGSTVDVLLSAVTVTDQDGKLQSLLGTGLDLTEQRQLRDDLRRSRAYYQSLLEASSDGLVTVDADGLIADVTGQVCAIARSRREELIGTEFADLFRDRDPARDLVAQVLAGQAPGEAELGMVSDDLVRRVAVNASVFPGQQDAAGQLVASIRDVTEQVRLRDRLAHERAYNRGIVEASANGLVISDLRHQITDVNGTMCELADRGRSDLLGSPLPGLFADQGAATDAAQRALLAGEVTNCELSLAPPHASPVLVNMSIMRDEAGQPTGLLTSLRDISEQARLAHDLAMEQAYARGLFESSVPALFIVDAGGGIIDVNEAACGFIGHARHRLLSRRFATLFVTADEAEAGVSRALREGRVEFLELTLAPVGRPPVAVGFHAGRFHDPRTDQDVLIVAVRDLTGQKTTERELHLYAQSLYGATSDALLITDPAGVITDVNHSMEELTGQAREDLIGRPAETCFTERSRAHEFIATVLREGKATDVELTVRRPDGGSTVLWYSAATFRDRAGKLQGIFASARDITERKKFEELQARMLERATELDQAKSDFVARVSHELRSPLTSVLGYLELIREGRPGPLTTDQQRMLEAMNRNGNRLLALIEDLLLLSRIEAGPVPISYQQVELGPLLRSVRDSFDRAIRSGQLTTQLDLASGVVIDGDPAQLERLAANLVSNAVKFTPPGGEIKITCRLAGDEAVIEVSDTGIGVPEAEQPQLFTRFFRSSISQAQETQGPGLGLFIVKHVAQAHGGQATVASAAGAGSTFTVRLPVHRPAQPARSGQGVDT